MSLYNYFKKHYSTLKQQCCIFKNTSSTNTQNVPIQSEPTKLQHSTIDNCCHLCNKCYYKLTGNVPQMKSIFCTEDDYKYWFNRALKYTGDTQYDAALLYFIEYNIPGARELQDYERLHRWLLTLKDMREPWDSWLLLFNYDQQSNSGSSNNEKVNNSNENNENNEFHML